MPVRDDPALRGGARRPKVLMIGPLPPPVGGMATVVGNLAEGFAGRVDLKLLNNVKTTAADRRLWEGIAAQLRLLGRLAGHCLGWRPDVVHVHTCSWFTFWRNAVDVLLARLLGRRVVLHIHGAQFRGFLEGLSPAARQSARVVFALAQRIVVLGEGWKALLDPWADPHRVVVVPNGVPVPERTAAGVRGGAAEPLRIVCLANYERRKGQADLLRAVARLTGPRPVRLELFGFEAEPGQRQALLDLARELGIAERVQVPGPVTGAAKDACLNAAGCFCLPSYDEGLPMSMLEAMALGLPVVVSEVGSIPEAVSDGEEGLLYVAGDIEALAAHLQRVLDDPDRALAIGRAGRARVQREFSLERSVQRLLQVYGGLTGGGTEADRAPLQ